MRARTAIQAALFCVAAVTAAAGLSVAATNTNRRFDLTLTGQHQLSDRTIARLRALDVPVELVVAVARTRLDPRQADRVDDILAALDSASDNLTITMIDVTGSGGPEKYEQLVERLENRDASSQAGRLAEFSQVVRNAEALRDDLGAFDVSATSTARSDPSNAQRLGEFAAFARVAQRQLGEVLGDQSAGGTVGSRAVNGQTVVAIAAIAKSLSPQFESLQSELGALSASPRARGLLSETTRIAATLRARVGTLAETKAPTSDLDRVAGAISSGETALLIGPERQPARPGEAPPPGLVALDLNELYPSLERAATSGQDEASARARAEQIVTAGLTVLTDETRPIVVFVHGEPQRWVGQAGVITGLIQRLAAAGIDYAEWPVVLDEAAPDLAAIDPFGLRPVVYAVISPNTTAASNPNIPQSTPGSERAGRVGAAVAQLIDTGKPVLLSLNPSVFPTFGDTDPIASLIAPFGVDIHSARPVLRRANTSLGPTTTPTSRIVPKDIDESLALGDPTSGVITGAVRGLPVVLEWPLPMEITPRFSDDSSIGPDRALAVRPLLTIDAEDAWSESEWLNYWRTPRAQRTMLRDPPVFDVDSDDATGPFTVAAAIEITPTSTGAVGLEPARLVVVGSNTWFLDQAWRSQQTVSGRSILAHPGNPELFDAAVLWLANREELIATSPAARPIARIQPVSESTLSLLRWSLIGGLPLGILCLGGAYRVIRR